MATASKGSVAGNNLIAQKLQTSINRFFAQVAQAATRYLDHALRMREVQGSIPCCSTKCGTTVRPTSLGRPSRPGTR